eukprot:Transcript_969.p1 GENE.Transcript_969~~Transcript_969.p1  ORF type:complete len:155 (+),score=40.22 Transcript_969:182-646(+)
MAMILLLVAVLIVVVVAAAVAGVLVLVLVLFVPSLIVPVLVLRRLLGMPVLVLRLLLGMPMLVLRLLGGLLIERSLESRHGLLLGDLSHRLENLRAAAPHTSHVVDRTRVSVCRSQAMRALNTSFGLRSKQITHSTGGPAAQSHDDQSQHCRPV